MRKNIVLLGTAMCIMASVACTQTTSQQNPPGDEGNQFLTRNMGGPRFGLTIIPGNGELAQKLQEHNVGRVISQFGWHFEKDVVFRGQGPSFVIEFIPLFGGVEYGKFIPSATLAMGIRFPSGFEFGIGPNVLFGEKVNSALLMALGKTFDFGGVAIPLNLALVTSPAGTRIGIMTGYAIN